MFKSIILSLTFSFLSIFSTSSFAQEEDKVYGEKAFISLQNSLGVSIYFQEDFAKEFVEKMVCDKKYWSSKGSNMNMYCSSFTERGYFGVLSIGESITNTFVSTKEFSGYSAFKDIGLGVNFNYKCSYSKDYPGKVLNCITTLLENGKVFASSSVFNLKSADNSKVRMIIGFKSQDKDLLAKETENIFKMINN